MSVDEIISAMIDSASNEGVELQQDAFLPTGMDWASTTIWGIMDTCYSVIINGIMSIFDLCYKWIVELSDVSHYIENADGIINGIADIATLILAIIFLKQIFTNYILDLDGDADADPIQSLVNIATALAVINCGGEIHNVLMKICNLSIDYIRVVLFASEIDTDLAFTEYLVNNFAKGAGASLAMLVVPGAAWVSILVSVWILVVGILMIVLACKVLFRGVELFIFQCLMPIFACDLVTPNKELWKPFLKAYLTTIFGWLIQYFCLMLSVSILLQSVTPSAGIEGLMSPLISTVMLYFACKAPKWLQNFTYQTGAGQAVSSGARGIVGTASSVVSAATSIK